MQLDEIQEEAVRRCCDMSQTNRLVPISGAAGTGKTTIMREVYNRLSDAGYTLALCAPTGKAAKRITEATGIPAMTIHRLLEFSHPGERDPKTGKPYGISAPKRHAGNRLPYAVILADEYAMVPSLLHRQLIEAIPPGGVLRMFGDKNQLQPIETANTGKPSPFAEAMERFSGVELQRIHRQGEGSGIVMNAKQVLRRMVPRRTDDFDIIVTNEPVTALNQLVIKALERGLDYGTLAGQIITPTNKSWVGTHKLNAVVQRLLNPNPPTGRIVLPRETWDAENKCNVGIGDKVICTENTYDLLDFDDPTERTDEHRIMNGETGIVTAIDDILGTVTIDLGDRKVQFPPVIRVERANGAGFANIDPRKRLYLAYVVTTHKAQGSEWDEVTIVLNRSSMFMQCIPNFYTAITRGRKRVTVITDQPSLITSSNRLQSAASQAKPKE